MNIESKIRSWLCAASPQASDSIVLAKKIGEIVQVHIEIDKMQLSTYVGFRLYFPSQIMSPVMVEGSENAVACTDGNVYADRPVDLVCNLIKDDVEGTFIYVSKALKSGEPAGYESARIVTLNFVCDNSGEGLCELTERKYGNAIDGSAYASTSIPVSLTLQATQPDPEPVVAVFRIVIE